MKLRLNVRSEYKSMISVAIYSIVATTSNNGSWSTFHIILYCVLLCISTWYPVY